MKIFKAGESIKYKIPGFTCTKCNFTQLFDPGFHYSESALKNEYPIKKIEKCPKCNNDEFLYDEFSTILGPISSSLTKE